MLISLCAVQAQQNDTTGTASQSHDRQQQRQQYGQQREQARKQRDQRRMQDRQAWRQQRDQYRDSEAANQGMVVVDKNDIPESLKKTLKKDKYAGWEDGTIYHNTNTGEYVIAPRAYRFDENGKEIEFSDADAGNRSGDEPSNSYRQYNEPSDQSGDQSSMQRSDDRTNESGESVHDEAGQYSDSRSSEMASDQYPATEQDNERKAGKQEPSSSYRNDQSTSDRNAQEESAGEEPSTTESQRDNGR